MNLQRDQALEAARRTPVYVRRALPAARAAAEGIAALQRGEIRVHALQSLHAERAAKARHS